MFTRSKTSITEVRSDQVQLRKILTKHRRNHNPLESSYSPTSVSVNQAYFAVPLATCLTNDLIEPISDPKQVTLENVIGLFTSDEQALKELNSKEEHFTHLQ